MEPAAPHKIHEVIWAGWETVALRLRSTSPWAAASQGYPHLRGGRGWLPHFPPGFGFRCLSERFLKLLVWVLYFISSQGLPPPTKTEVKAWLDGFCGREN